MQLRSVCQILLPDTYSEKFENHFFKSLENILVIQHVWLRDRLNKESYQSRGKNTKFSTLSFEGGKCKLFKGFPFTRPDLNIAGAATSAGEGRNGLWNTARVLEDMDDRGQVALIMQGQSCKSGDILYIMYLYYVSYVYCIIVCGYRSMIYRYMIQWLKNICIYIV